MASSTELIEVVAHSLGIQVPTIALHLRNLREAGLLSQGGRGRNSARMTSRDAANVLIASVGSRSVKDSASLIDRPGNLVSGRDWKLAFLDFPELADLPAQHSFADAIEVLIAAAISGSLQAAAEKLQGSSVDLMHDLVPALNIEVTVLGPTPRGAILIEELTRDEDDGVSRQGDNFERHFYGNRPTQLGAGNLAWYDMSRPAETDSDLRSEMTFTHKTIMTVGNLLRGDDP